MTLTMNAFNKGGRFIRIFGTKGELTAYAEDDKITVYTFADRQQREVPITQIGESILDGHGGGDAGMIGELYEYLGDSYNGYCAADILTSVKNHLIGFAAEKSRREDTVESVDGYMKAYGLENA